MLAWNCGVHICASVFGLQDARAVHFAAVQQHHARTAHIGRYRREAAGPERIEDSKTDPRVFGAGAVAFRSLQRLRERLEQGGVRHLLRRVDVPVGVLLERLAADALDDIAARAYAGVRVGGNDAWREDAPGLIRDKERAASPSALNP